MSRSSFVLITLLLICGYCMAQPSFRFRRDITGVKEEGWYALTLPGAMLQELNPGLADLRLYSLNGGDTVELPYILRIHDDEVMERKVDLALFNQSSRNGLLYLTFELQPAHKVNFIRLEFDEENYFGHVTIEGSDDRIKWFEVAKDERIVSMDKEGNDYILSSIRFPLSGYRYLRVSVNSDTPLHFRNASFAYDSIRPGKYQDLPLTWIMKTDKASGRTYVDIAMNEFNPVSILHVEIENERDYYRPFTIEYVRDSVKSQKGWIRNYEHLFNGYLTSFEVNRFVFPVAFSKDLRLVISDRDNSPLVIKQVSAEGPFVTVVSYLKPGDNFVLYGSDVTHKPDYDLAHFQNKIPEHPAAAKLGEPEEIILPEDEGGGLFESSVWLWVIMIVMIGGLGFFTLKMMKGKA